MQNKEPTKPTESRTQLISIRIESDVLQLIDEYCQHRDYLNRSRLINLLLAKIFKKHTENYIYYLLNL